MHLDLKQVLESVEREKNVDRELIISALKEALLTAAKRFHGECSFEARLNEETKEMELWKYMTVVEDEQFQNPLREVKFSDALKMDDTLQVGDEIGEAVPSDQLGRIATQSARQVVVQKMSDAEKDRVVRDFKEKKGHLVHGIVRRFDKQDIVVDLGSCEGVLPAREQIPGEKFKNRDKVTCYVLDVKRSTRGPQVILSRADPGCLVRLFEQEVAEIADGIVIIHGAARDPGGRSKIAVSSNEPSVDPVGSCVGVKGSRVQSIVQELHGEKIDVIPYHPDPARFVCNALAPAIVTKVVVNERTRMMEVVVPDDQLSLAIGRRGQNVRLAAQLTGWKVDIRSESKMKDLLQEYKNSLASIQGLGEMRAEILVNEGYRDPNDVARLDMKTLIRLTRLSEEEAELVLKNAAEVVARLASERADLEGLDSDLAELQEVLGGSEFEEESDEAAIENIVGKTKLTPLLDPEKVEPQSVDLEILKYWMKLRGVGEQTAAVLHLGGFVNYTSLAAASLDDIVYKTGLPHRLAGRLHAEVAKKLAAE